MRGPCVARDANAAIGIVRGDCREGRLKMARIVELIVTHRTTGRGTEDDYCRRIDQLWTKDGNLLAEYDSGKSQGSPAIAMINGEILRHME